MIIPPFPHSFQHSVENIPVIVLLQIFVLWFFENKKTDFFTKIIPYKPKNIFIFRNKNIIFSFFLYNFPNQNKEFLVYFTNLNK